MNDDLGFIRSKRKPNVIRREFKPDFQPQVPRTMMLAAKELKEHELPPLEQPQNMQWIPPLLQQTRFQRANKRVFMMEGDMFIDIDAFNRDNGRHGMKEKEIAQMKICRYGELSQEDREIDENCPMCMDIFEEDEKIMQVTCKHIFHNDCVKEWLKMSNTCPKCRFIIE